MSDPYNNNNSGYGYPPAPTYGDNGQQHNSQYPPQQQSGYPPQQGYGAPQHGSYGPPAQGGFEHAQSGANYAQGQQYGGQQYGTPQPQYGDQQGYQGQQAPYGSAPSNQFPQQGAYNQNPYPSDPNNASLPGPGPNGEQDRGLMGALAGGAAGGWGGHKAGHGIIGAIAGAIAGSKLEDFGKDKYKQSHNQSQGYQSQGSHHGRRGIDDDDDLAYGDRR